MSIADSPNKKPTGFDDRPGRWFLLATAFWAMISAAGAVVLALLLLLPKLFYELGDPAQHFSFGRLYPAQMQVLVYGLLGNGFFAFVYFSIQRLERIRLVHAPLAMLHWVAWQTMIVMATVASTKLLTQGRWLGWMEWPFDLALIAIWLCLFVPVVTMTLRNRSMGTKLPAPLWFTIAIIVAIPVLQFVANLSTGNQPTPGRSVYLGVQDVMVQWWTARGFVSFWITVPAVAILYFLVPRVGNESNAPSTLFSHRITIIHFWSIALLGCWGGNFQWHFTSLPEWTDSIAMFAGLLLWLGCLAGAYNLWRSLPRLNRSERSVSLRLTSASVVCYAIYSFDSALMSFKSAGILTQFTDWSTANLLLGVLGVSGLSMIAFSLFAIPQLVNVPSDPRRGHWLRWLAVEGAAFQVIALYVAGMVQAYTWNNLDDHGRLENAEFLNAIGWVQPLWITVAVGSAVWFFAMLIWFGLLLRSFAFAGSVSTPISQDIVLIDADPVVVPSRLIGAPVLGAAISLEQWSQLTWHAILERRPGAITRRVFVALAAGTALIWLPSVLYRGSKADASLVTQSPYTDLELLGREIYVREGCVSCHTQASRPLLPEVLRYGEYSRASDYAFDRPTQLGFRRVGPDLAREGGRQASFWHWKHLENPQIETPQSVMPAFDHVLNQTLEVGENASIAEQAQSIAADIVGAGGPVIYGNILLMNSRGIALIAYLQRLGVVTKAPNPATNEK